ncbi:tyrosine--tRNA ligase [Pelagibacteraceae bacterium]|nr:tyrosine--tRNA ligase [Pelagibacteraceae bacterium]
MNNNIKDFISIIRERGFIHQTTDLDILSKEYSKIIGYTGFDCTSNTLHVGSLLQLMLLRWLQKTNNKPIILLGGGTTKIGDPSGKDTTRKILSEDEIVKNSLGIKSIINKYITFDNSDCGAVLVDNSEWLDNLNYIKFLRTFGKYFSVNRMLTFDSVRTRLEREQNLSFLEFNYMITQAYDYYYLHKELNCNVQFGGSDQWGNIINGIDLIKKATPVENKNVHAITSPLITTSNGKKMGKTASGAIWLSEKDFSVFDFWQFWRNTSDADVIKFLKIFTEISLSEIKKLSKLKGEEINEAKIILANEITSLTHGKEKSLKVLGSIQGVMNNELGNNSLPSVNLKKDEVKKGILAYKLFCLNSILCSSNSDSRRLITQGAAKINGKKLLDFNYLVTEKDLLENNAIQISIGKKKHALINII